MSEQKGFKFVITLVSEFKKIKSDNETKYNIFYANWKGETIIIEVDH